MKRTGFYSALALCLAIALPAPAPAADNTITFDKTVVATLILTNTYFVGSPGQATVNVQDTDPLSANVVVAAITRTVEFGVRNCSSTTSRSSRSRSAV